MVCPQPDGIGQFVGGGEVVVDVGVLLGVSDSSENVGTSVAVRGTGEGGMLLITVGSAFGTNSTSEMDKAPTINPMEISATTSALLKSRPARIICFPLLFVLHQRSVIAR